MLLILLEFLTLACFLQPNKLVKRILLCCLATFEAKNNPNILSIQQVIAITLLYVFIFLIGLVGNCAIIYWHVDSRSPYYQRTASNPLVINLCLSDLMVILFCCPFVAYGKNTSIWKFGEFLCTVVHYLQGKLRMMIGVML